MLFFKGIVLNKHGSSGVAINCAASGATFLRRVALVRLDGSSSAVGASARGTAKAIEMKQPDAAEGAGKAAAVVDISDAPGGEGEAAGQLVASSTKASGSGGGGGGSSSSSASSGGSSISVLSGCCRFPSQNLASGASALGGVHGQHSPQLPHTAVPLGPEMARGAFEQRLPIAA